MARFYLTTPIYYVNDVPHLGHAYTTVNADAIARWHRLCGEEVRLVTGTDEHGRKISEAASMHGVEPQEWVDRTSQRFREAWDLLEVAADRFVRTTEPRHELAVQRFLGAIYDNGFIELGTFEGLYCVACEAYYGHDELDDGNCPVHGRPVELMKEENYFFKLSAFQDRLLQWYESHPNAVAPESRRNEALGFIRGGLQDISITRTSIDWGIRVPWDPAHVFYVWFDALVGYLTGIDFDSGDDEFAPWWAASHHLLGKDIVRFHAVWWPAMCMAAGIDPPQRLFVHGWLLVGGEKMSKTRLNQITPAQLVSELGVDAVRYHLLRDNPLGPDGDFSYEAMTARYNADLANNLGNLLARVAAVVTTKCAGIGPPAHCGAEGGEAPGVLEAAAGQAVRSAGAAWERFAPHEALEAVWGLIHEANATLESAQPWKLDPGDEVDRALGDALEVLRIVAVLAWPAMPATCEEIWRRIGLAGTPADVLVPGGLSWGGYRGGVEVEKGEPLFPRWKP